MENKYYTPTIEEFHVGFEYEWNNSDEDDVFRKSIADLEDCYHCVNDIINNIDYYKYRVKYLDKEDIESLGWKESFRGGRFDIKTDNDDFQMYLHDNLDKGFYFIEIYDWDSQYVFRGKIKNKSELKILLKQLGVND